MPVSEAELKGCEASNLRTIDITLQVASGRSIQWSTVSQGVETAVQVERSGRSGDLSTSHA